MTAYKVVGRVSCTSLQVPATQLTGTYQALSYAVSYWPKMDYRTMTIKGDDSWKILLGSWDNR